MTKFDAEKIIKDLSEEQKQKLIEELAGEPEKKKEESLSAVSHSHVMRNSPVTTEIKKTKQEGRVTERSREPFKPIKQTCTRCSKTIETNPQFYREFYICDSCLKR